MTDIHDLTKDEIRERTMEKFASMVYYVTNESLETFSLRMQVSWQYSIGGPFSLPKIRYLESVSMKISVLMYQQLIGIADPGFWTRFGVSYGLFLGALRSGATPNQLCKSSSPSGPTPLLGIIRS